MTPNSPSPAERATTLSGGSSDDPTAETEASESAEATDSAESAESAEETEATESAGSAESADSGPDSAERDTTPAAEPAEATEPAHNGHWSSSDSEPAATAAVSTEKSGSPSADADATTTMPAVSDAAPTTVVPPVSDAVPTTVVPPVPPTTPPRAPSRPARPRPPARGPRRARLQLRGVSVWSALRFSVVLSIALFCVWMVMVGVLYGILDGVGAIEKVNEAIFRIDPEGSEQVVTPSMVFGGGVVIGAVYMVLFIALSTVGTLIYNLCADLVGGLELTLSERD